MLIFISLIFLSLSLLIFSRYSNNQSLEIIFKPLTISLIFIYVLTCYINFENSVFTLFISLGLLFSIFGDMALMFEKKFKLGMIFFLLTHLCYLKSIHSLYGFHMHWSVIIISAIFYIFYTWTLPLIPKNLKAPVLCYVVCILFLIAQSYATLILLNKYYLVYFNIGILLFAISDWLLIIGRYNVLKYRHINLPIYFIGQLLIAHSCYIK